MKPAAALAIMAVGTIIALAVNVRVPGFNLHVAGIIIALVGLAGMLLQKRASNWIRQRTVLHGDFADRSVPGQAKARDR